MNRAHLATGWFLMCVILLAKKAVVVCTNFEFLVVQITIKLFHPSLMANASCSIVEYQVFAGLSVHPPYLMTLGSL